MADTTYQPKIYIKQGGDISVVASGGEEIIESGGKLSGESGGILNLEDGFMFYWDDSSSDKVTAENLKAVLLGGAKFSVRATSTISTSFSVGGQNLFNSVKYYIFSMTSTMVNGSAWLCSSPTPGQTMDILIRGGSCASGLLLISCSGVSLVNYRGSDISRITLYNSGASAAYMRVLATSSSEWSIIRISSETMVVTT